MTRSLGLSQPLALSSVLLLTGLAGLAGHAIARPQTPPASPASNQAPARPRFTIFIYESPAELARRNDNTDSGQQYWAAYAAFAGKLEKAGVMTPAGCCLQPDSAARVIRSATGKPVVSEGAYASAPAGHQLGGYFVIEVDTLEAALDWARQAPSTATGAVEVRPAYPMPPMMSHPR